MLQLRTGPITPITSDNQANYPWSILDTLDREHVRLALNVGPRPPRLPCAICHVPHVSGEVSQVFSCLGYKRLHHQMRPETEPALDSTVPPSRVGETALQTPKSLVLVPGPSITQ